MRTPISISTIVALIQGTTLAISIPQTPDLPPSLAVRATYCANAPTVAVGTLLNPSLVVPITQFSKLPNLDLNIYWCQPSSQTYVSISVTRSILPVSWPGIQARLQAAVSYAQSTIATLGDGVIPGSSFWWGDGPGKQSVYLNTQNANNHQQTWGVLGAAISAVNDFGQTLYAVGVVPRTLNLLIYDGSNEVATGMLSS